MVEYRYVAVSVADSSAADSVAVGVGADSVAELSTVAVASAVASSVRRATGKAMSRLSTSVSPKWKRGKARVAVAPRLAKERIAESFIV